MTDQEIIYKAIREVVNTDNPSQFAAHNSTCYAIAKYVCEELREELDSTPAEQPSEELEKAADYYLDNTPTAELMYGSYEGPDVYNAFVAGANWQKEQMMKSAIEVKINRDTLYNLKPIIHEKYQDLKIGDKILIIKEEEQ